MAFGLRFRPALTIKLILIIAKFYCMLLLAATPHSLITAMARKFKV